MAHTGRRRLIAVILLGSALPLAAPALAFELFGIHLWGGEEDEDVVEVIDPVRYDILFEVDTDREDLEGALRDASALWVDRDAPAPGRAGLIAKARGDYRRLLAALYNAGHYGPEISITLAGREAAEVTLADPLPAELPVTVTVRPGPRFRFGIAEIVNAPPWTKKLHPGMVDFEIGATARATRVAAASQLAVERWRQISHAKAQESAREVVADHATNRLEARIFIDPGRAAVYGPVQVEGGSRVDADFIAYMADLEPGSPFDSEEIAEAQARLVRLGTFTVAQIEEGEEIAPDGTLPISIRVEDRLPRSFGIGGSYGTLDGLALEGFWLHRNLLGRAEQLRLDATIARIGTTADPADLTYQVGVSFIRPGVIEPNTSFVSSLIGRQQDLDTYRERAVTGRVGLAHEFGSALSGEVALEATRSRVEDAFGVRHFLTVGPAARLQYDRRDDVLNPTEGYFLLASARPFYEAEFGNFIARGTLEGRAYRALDAKRRSVLAGRARIGSFVGPAIEESPPDQLFFAGGGGSVRGYDFRSIGVETSVVDGETDAVGGRSLLELSTEIRARFGENFGLVGFVDGGYVAEHSGFGGEGELRVGAGVGFRYFTGLGPLRVDVATPIDRRPQDSQLALYLGIGQAF